MKRTRNALSLSLVALAFVALCGASARAQIHDSRILVARAGGVNYVSGDVTTRRGDGKSWLRLSANDELKSGDIVHTGADGLVEVLLNPGSYFRAGGDTMFTLADASLEDLRVAMVRGSAVVEATGYGGEGGTDISITVLTPRTTTRIVRSGVYRIDVNAAGAAEVTVLKGRAFVGTELVKGGRVAREGAGGLEVAKLDKKGRDPLDQWSRDRGKELARANSKLSRSGVNAMLAQAGSNVYGGLGRNGVGGVWVWNPRFGGYTFAPFNTYYWQSPYGYGYGTGVYYYPDPYNNQTGGSYTPPRPGTQPSPGDTGAAGNGKPMPPREIGPPRDNASRDNSARDMPRHEVPRNEVPRYESPRYESHQSAPVRESAPVQQSMPSQSMSAPARATEELPQRNAPPE